MAAPKTIRSNGKLLQASDPCPRACNDGKGGAVHLVSDHDEAKANQCSKCMCVIQDVRNHINRDQAKAGF